MAQVMLNEAAKETIRQIAGLGLPDATAIVITSEARTDSLTARFIDKSTLDSLKTRVLGEALPGIEVHLFGIEDFPDNSRIELTFLPVRSTTMLKKYLQKNSVDTNLSYFFRVAVKSECSAQSPQSKAG